jgi:hypothetical protein
MENKLTIKIEKDKEEIKLNNSSSNSPIKNAIMKSYHEEIINIEEIKDDIHVPPENMVDLFVENNDMRKKSSSFSKIHMGSVSLNCINEKYNEFTKEVYINFYDIEPKKIDKFVDFCVSPHYYILLVPIPFWIIWGVNINNSQLFFSLSMSSTIFSILQTNSYIIKYIYGKQETFDNLYLKKKITEKTDKFIIEKRFQKLFIIIAIFVITISAFGFIYFQLFDFREAKNTPAQIFVLIFGALLSIENIQRVLCSNILWLLIKHQRFLIKKNNLLKFNNNNINFNNI